MLEARALRRFAHDWQHRAAAARLADQRLDIAERQQAANCVTSTGREREALQAMDRGEQSKVIAWKLGLSRRTIDMHRTNILGNLSARNAVHAIAIARDLGLVSA